MKYVFIVGCPRSGTTLLQQALNRHSQIVIPPESKFFYYFYGQSYRRQSAHLERINSDLGIELVPPRRRIVQPAEAREFYEKMAAAYLDRLGRRDIAVFGDKCPEHTGQLYRIGKVFPDAKVLFIYRDGRDVAVSLRRMPWIRCDAEVAFVIWLYCYKILSREQRSPTLPTLFVRYEELVADPANHLARVAQFLELPYEPAMAEGWGNREGIPERELAWKGRALEPITGRWVGMWRQELSAAEVARLERLGRHALMALNYPLMTEGRMRLPIGFWLKLLGKLIRCAAQLPLPCLMNELHGSLYRTFHRASFTNAGS